METITTINPCTGGPVATYAMTPSESLDAAVAAANRAFGDWRAVSLPDRAACFIRCAALLRERADAYAALMATEMGKPVKQGRAEVEKCAWVCAYFAEKAEAMLADVAIPTGVRTSYACCEPLGAILAIMPWNFPFWQLFRFAAPSMMAGNAVVLKHAPGTAGCGEAIEQLFRDAGFPEGLLANVRVPDERVADLIRHPLIRGVTLTGSPRAGRSVASAAGAALKKTVLELGGSDPYLVLADADIGQAADLCVKSRLLNSGQTCISAKRWIVERPVARDFEAAVVEQMRRARVGDPMDPATEVGPLARADLRDALHRQVTRSVKLGATCLLGGTLPEGSGFFYPPTILAGVAPGMPAFDEELFGPAAALIVVSGEDEAIAIANATPYGLGAAVFTADPARGERIARERLRAGCCFVNDFVKSDPRLPFGGVGESGYGRELGPFGILEFVNIKTISVA